MSYSIGLAHHQLSFLCICSYTDKTRQALRGYAHRMIEADIQDWSRTQCPDADVNGHYHTAVAVLLFQMLDQNVIGTF